MIQQKRLADKIAWDSSVHFIKADNHDGFYELFTLCVEGLPVTGDVDNVSLLGFLHVRQELTCNVKVTLHCKKGERFFTVYI